VREGAFGVAGNQAVEVIVGVEVGSSYHGREGCFLLEAVSGYDDWHRRLNGRGGKQLKGCCDEEYSHLSLPAGNRSRPNRCSRFFKRPGNSAETIQAEKRKVNRRLPASGQFGDEFAGYWSKGDADEGVPGGDYEIVDNR
jgi:hypothetical protein